MLHPAFHTLVLLWLGATPLVRGETERRYAYGDQKGEDSAAYQGDQKSKQMLTPRMTMHFQNAQRLRKEAEDARQRQDESTAQQKERMADMEQMKGQQLQQQINENQKSADKNRESEKLVSKDADGSLASAITKGIQSITVDKERLANKEAANALIGSSSPSSPASAAAPSPEIAKLEDFSSQRRALDLLAPTKIEPAPVAKVEAPVDTGKPWEAELDQLGKKDRLGIGYADNTAPSSSTARTPITTVEALASGPAPQARLLSAATEASSPNTAPGITPAEGTIATASVSPPSDRVEDPTTTETRTKGMKILGPLKPKEKTDDGFWKKVGSSPKKKEKTARKLSRRTKSTRSVVSLRKGSAEK